MPTPWTDTDDQILRKWHGQDLSDRDIAMKMGRNHSTVSNMRRELGLPVNKKRVATVKIPRPHCKRQPTLNEVKKTTEWYRDGFSIKTIGLKLKCGYQMVSDIINTLGLRRTPLQGNKNPHKALIIHLFQSKFGTCAKIAAEVQRRTGDTTITKNSVIGVLNRAGLQSRQVKHGKVAKFFTRASGKSTVVFQRDPYRGEAPTGCRYPEGEGASLKWCNAERRQGSPYCHPHHLLTHQPIMSEAAE